MAGDGVGHFPLFGGSGDGGPGADSPRFGVEVGDHDALDIGLGDGAANVVAVDADGQICSIDRLGLVAI